MNAEKKITASSDSELIRIALLDKSIENIDKTLIRLELKMDKGFDEIKNDMKDMKSDYIRLEHKMNTNFSEITKEMKSDFKWLLGTIFALSSFTITGLIGLGTLMAHGFHWF